MRLTGRGNCEYTTATSRSGGTGRRARLKIVYLRVCGFDSHLRQEKKPLKKTEGLFVPFIGLAGGELND